MFLLLEYCGSSSFCKLKIIILQDNLSRPIPQEMITSRSYIFTKTSRCNIFIFSGFDEKKSSRNNILKISSRFFSTQSLNEKKNGFHFSSKTSSILSRTLRFDRAQSSFSHESFPSTIRCNTCERNEFNPIKGSFRKATVYF